MTERTVFKTNNTAKAGAFPLTEVTGGSSSSSSDIMDLYHSTDSKTYRVDPDAGLCFAMTIVWARCIFQGSTDQETKILLRDTFTCGKMQAQYQAANTYNYTTACPPFGLKVVWESEQQEDFRSAWNDNFRFKVPDNGVYLFGPTIHAMAFHIAGSPFRFFDPNDGVKEYDNLDELRIAMQRACDRLGNISFGIQFARVEPA